MYSVTELPTLAQLIPDTKQFEFMLDSSQLLVLYHDLLVFSVTTAPALASTQGHTCIYP